MKAVILAGGLGTRLSEETNLKPKPMVDIGGMPILWHIMKIYLSHGVDEFIICLGYKGYIIKEFFSNYSLHMSDVTFDMKNGSIDIHRNKAEPWKVTLVDTGLMTATGGRLKKVRSFLGDEDFCFTYGDGVADVNITELLGFHREHKRLVTMTAVQPPGRFGSLDFDGDEVQKFVEKPSGDGGWINGGFFVVSPKAIDHIEGDNTPWEGEPLHSLVAERNLMAYKHKGFWRPMDTLRDRDQLEQLWAAGTAPWKVWK